MTGDGAVVFSVPDYFPTVGGTCRQVRVQAEALVARGHRVEVVTRRRSPSWAADETVGGVRVHRISESGESAWGDKAAAAALAVWLVRNRRRIRVHQPVMWTDALYGAGLARLLDRTASIWASKGDVTKAVASRGSAVRWAQGSVRRRCVERSYQVVLTPGMAAEVRAAGLEADTTVIPVPVDLGVFRPAGACERDAARADLDLPAGAFTIVYVGRLHPDKGIDRLIEALARLRAHTPDARLVIVGSGRGELGNEPALRGQVAAAGLEGAVTFTGAVLEPVRHLWAADVLALPSLKEGMPNCIVEAMACGLPCVAPPSASGDELITDATGIVPASNDPGELHAALRTLASGPELRRRMSAAAVASVAHCGVERVIDRYEELFARMEAVAR